MSLSAGKTRPAILAERLLITRFITSIGLALIVLFAFAVSTHSESASSASVDAIAVAVESIDSHIEAPAAVAGSDSAAFADPVTSLSDVAGSAMCVLGILCGLTVVAFLLRLGRRRVLPELGLAPRWSTMVVSLTAHRALPALTLAQLGISRT